jgi:hypothetical protein
MNGFDDDTWLRVHAQAHVSARSGSAGAATPAVRTSRIRAPREWLSCLLLATVALAAEVGATDAAAPPRPAPSVDPKPSTDAPIARVVTAVAPAPAPLAYRSAFARYRAWSQPESPTWRAVNDRVREVGGWREYLRQVQEPASP